MRKVAHYSRQTRSGRPVIKATISVKDQVREMRDDTVHKIGFEKARRERQEE